MISHAKSLKTEEELYQFIEDYNWDDGFPYDVIENKACTMPIALRVFDLSDGYTYLTNKDGDEGTKNWYSFMEKLYSRIINNEFPAGKMPYEPELSKVQIYKLKKILSEKEIIFITPQNTEE